MAHLVNSAGIIGTFSNKGFQPRRPDNTPARNVGHVILPKMDAKKKKRQ